MNPERYKKYVYPLFERIDPELSHDIAIKLLQIYDTSFINRFVNRYNSPRLHTHVLGLEFDNPFIVAAGFDKNGQCVRGLYNLGFSSVVAGTFVKFPQVGNEKPRIHRIGKNALINSMGFPSEGIEKAKKRLHKYQNRDFPLGVSIGLNKNFSNTDAAFHFAQLTKSLYPLADYFEVNISSPNTPGLIDLSNRHELIKIITSIKTTMSENGKQKPLFVKISPDLTIDTIDQIVDLSLQENVGIVATNTSSNSTIKSNLGVGGLDGGISGDPLRQLSNKIIKHIYQESGGKAEIIGVGGVDSAKHALEKILLGAKSVSLYTGFRSEGPGLPNKLSVDLDDWMDKHGVESIEEIVGKKE